MSHCKTVARRQASINTNLYCFASLAKTALVICRSHLGSSIKLSTALDPGYFWILTVVVATTLVTSCSTAPKPLKLTYPLSWVDYNAIPSLDNIATRVSPYFVKVFIYDDLNPVEAVGVGSGTILDELGHVITAAHIVKNKENRAFIKDMRGTTLPARVIHVDPDRELALLRISIRYEAISEPPEVDLPTPGQTAFAIGTQPAYDPVVSAGVARSHLPGKQFRSGHYGFESPIALDMHVDTGYSGGPVFNTEGKLLGMIVGFDGVSTEWGNPERILTSYAIPSSKLYEYYYQWR
ncbi:serine protease [Pseudomonadota bacterium]